MNAVARSLTGLACRTLRRPQFRAVFGGVGRGLAEAMAQLKQLKQLKSAD